MPEYVKCYLEDETVRYKEILRKDKQRQYWRNKTLIEEEKNIVLPEVVIPKYKKKVRKFNLTPANIVAFASNCLKAIAP